MKILIIARGIPSVKDPQEGCFEWDQAKALAARGHEVFIMAVDGRVRKFWRHIGIKCISKDNIIAYKLFYFPTAIIRRLISLKLGYSVEAFLARRLYRHIINKHGTFDIVHSHYLNCSYFGTTIKKSFGCNLVGTEHWSEVNKRILSYEIEYLGRKTYLNLDKLISVSKDLGKSIYKHFGKKSTVIHNLIDVTNLLPALKKTDNKDFTIICVGSLIFRKGFDIMIKSFAKSSLINKNVVVKIFGGGKEFGNLNSLINKFNLENKIILCGQKRKSEIYKELHKSDLFVLSSRLENFSVAIIEATANGVPAIGTLCGGIEEYPIKDVVKIPIDDIDAMSSALEYCYSRKDTVDRESIQKETLHYFSPDAIASQLETVYMDLLESKK